MKKGYGLLSLLGLLILMHTTALAGIPISDYTKQEDVVEKKEQLINKKSKKGISLIKKISSKFAKATESVALAVALTILMPFLGIAVWQDAVTKDFWITLILTLLLYVPGLIYALSIIINDSR